jgi:xanthine dehydrogenase accessory factor
VLGHSGDRVLRAPVDGVVTSLAAIGAALKQGQAVATVDGHTVSAPFDGVLRGLVHDGVEVKQGVKIGDVDPRGDPVNSVTISEKSLAVGGGVVEAVLSSEAIRRLIRSA